MAQGGPEIASAKAAMRAGARVRRAELFEAAGREYSAALARNGVRFLGLSQPGAIAGYHPVHSEFDDLALLDMLARSGWTIGLPVVTAKNAPLTFRSWKKGDMLEKGSHGIPAPAKSAISIRPDVILVPLLAFDRRGFRLGYGGGFYDRTLAMMRKSGPVTAIGLAFAGQAVDAVPHDRHDQRLDWVLTEAGPWRCG